MQTLLSITLFAQIGVPIDLSETQALIGLVVLAQFLTAKALNSHTPLKCAAIWHMHVLRQVVQMHALAGCVSTPAELAHLRVMYDLAVGRQAVLNGLPSSCWAQR